MFLNWILNFKMVANLWLIHDWNDCWFISSLRVGSKRTALYCSDITGWLINSLYIYFKLWNIVISEEFILQVQKSIQHNEHCYDYTHNYTAMQENAVLLLYPPVPSPPHSIIKFRVRFRVTVDICTRVHFSVVIGVKVRFRLGMVS